MGSSTPAANVDRLPLHRGPFYFAPQYIRSREDWVETFATLLTKALNQVGCKAENLTPGDGWQVQVKLNTLIFTIDAEGGTFHLAEPDVDEHLPPPDNFWFTDIPATFHVRLEAEPVPRHLVDDARLAGSIAEWLYRAMKIRFEQALKSGEAHFEARLGTELADFTRVERDQFSLFDVDQKLRETFFEVDDELDSATARESGAKLFSLCVAPSGNPWVPARVSPFERGMATKRDRRRTVDHETCDNVMLDLMRRKGTPGKAANWNKEVFQKAVRAELQRMGKVVPGRATVWKKIPLIIEMLKKERSRSDFSKSSNSKIYNN